MADKRDYTVKTEGFILGEFRVKNGTVSLTERQAQTFLREGRVEAAGGKARRSASKTVGSDKS